MVDQPGRHCAGQILHGFRIKAVLHQPPLVVEHGLGKLPVLLLVGLAVAVVNGLLICLLIPEVINHIVLQKPQGLLIVLNGSAVFYRVYQVLGHTEQLHMLFVNPLHTEPVAVFPHHKLPSLLFSKISHHFTTPEPGKQAMICPGGVLKKWSKQRKIFATCCPSAVTFQHIHHERKKKEAA